MTQRRDPCRLFCKGRDAISSRPACTLPGANHHKNIQGITRPNRDHQTDHQPIADTGRTTERTSGAALAGFYRKGRAACSRSNFLHLLITWIRTRTSHGPTDLPFLLIFQLPSSAIFNINIHVFTFSYHFPSFHIKNGSFPIIQIHTGAPLAPFPQIFPKNHYKHENCNGINQ